MTSPFFSNSTKNLVVSAVKDIESKTSAEVVVSVRAQVDPYRDVDLLWGAISGIVAFVVLLFIPIELDEYLFPLEALIVFVAVSLFVSKVTSVKRALLSAKRRAARVLEAARAHFVEAGIDRTRDRTGILVFVSLLENEVTILPDRGIDAGAVGAPWEATLTALRASVAVGDPEAFAKALRGLGDPLGALYPRKQDDENELPDAPNMGTE